VRNFTILTFAAVLLLTCQPAFCQEAEADAKSAESSGMTTKHGKYRRSLEINYGSSSPRYEGLDQSFATLGLLEFKLGFKSLDDLKYNLISMDQHFGFLSFQNSGLSASGGAESGEIDSEMTRFGFGNRRGHGYGGSGKGFIFYNQDGLDWTQLKPVEYDAMNEDAQTIFDRYGSTYRFGQLTEAGIHYQLSPAFALNAGAEGAVIFPRTVFWPWLGSALLYSGVQGFIEIFSESIIEASPKAGPVIAWLLKSGVSAGYYYLLRDDMAWPFGYETPVTVGSFKVGANLTF
jgi:hypothetical protein